jgi:4-hydroxy-3-methylbut-2-enyl diphosphate reductase
MKVTIDQNSGYCFGVEFAIQMAEDELTEKGKLYCLGDIVHNDMEVERLNKMGLEVINKDDLKQMQNCRVLIRAHGEPPETYEIALKNNIELIDASCPVVLKLQNRIKHSYDQQKNQNGQVVIYGKDGHAEVIGLAGQTNQEAIVISSAEDLDKIDFSRPVTLYSQTTKSTTGFYKIKSEIEKRVEAVNGVLNQELFNANDSICRQVSNREPQLEKFSQENNVILFVSGKKSSNGKALHAVCKSFNDNSYFVESEKDINMEWFQPNDTVGICGATSTPMWLMEQVADFLKHNEQEVQLSF